MLATYPCYIQGSGIRCQFLLSSHFEICPKTFFFGIWYIASYRHIQEIKNGCDSEICVLTSKISEMQITAVQSHLCLHIQNHTQNWSNELGSYMLNRLFFSVEKLLSWQFRKNSIKLVGNSISTYFRIMFNFSLSWMNHFPTASHLARSYDWSSTVMKGCRVIWPLD